MSVFNVKKYGAFGDGKHNDWAAIEAAAEAARQAAAETGQPQTIFFPKGIYDMPPLVLGKDVSIEGETDGAVPA